MVIRDLRVYIVGELRWPKNVKTTLKEGPLPTYTLSLVTPPPPGQLELVSFRKIVPKSLRLTF